MNNMILSWSHVFFVFRTIDDNALKKIGDMGDFLTDSSIVLATSRQFNRKIEEQAFKTTFAALASILQEDSFRRYDFQRKRFSGSFLLSAFEAVAIGIGYNYESYSTSIPGDLGDRVRDLWKNKKFLSRIGSGVRGSQRVPHTIPLGRGVFRG